MSRLCFFLISAYFIFLSSCKYQRTNHKDRVVESIYIASIQNLSFAPQAASHLRNKIRQHIIRRGNFQITSDKSKSDLILRLSFKNYQKNPEIYNVDDTILASGVKLNLELLLNLENYNGDQLIKDFVLEEGSALLKQNSSSVPSDRQALIALSDLCARRISIQLENYNW